MSRTLIILILGLLMTSCFSGKYVTVEMLYPSQVELPYKGNKIGIISKYELIKDRPIIDTVIAKVDSLLYNEVLVSSSEILSKSATYQFCTIDLDSLGRLTYQEMLPTVASINLKRTLPDSLEVLLYLESLKLELKQASYRELLNASVPENYLLSISTWRIFNLQTKGYQRLQVSDTLEIRRETALHLLEDLYSAEVHTVYLIAASNHGRKFGQFISPTWLETDRVYFRSRVFFKNADKFVAEGNWKRAAEIWNEQTRSTEEMIASRACYNMAVAAEMEGYIDVALDWLQKADSKGLVEYVQWYKMMLQHQKKQIERLNLQFEKRK